MTELLASTQESTIEEHAERAQTPPAILAAAKAYYSWGAQKRMTAAEYEHAIQAIAGIVLH